MRNQIVLLALVAASLPFGLADAQETRKCTAEDVAVRLRVSEDSYSRDERVRMRIRAENISSTACEMEFPSGRGGTVRVFRDGELMWEHGYCRVYTDHIELETWEPGHSDSWGFRWKQHLNDRDEKGRIRCGEGEWPLASAGSYQARGMFFGTHPDAKTSRASFRLSG